MAAQGRPRRREPIAPRISAPLDAAWRRAAPLGYKHSPEALGSSQLATNSTTPASHVATSGAVVVQRARRRRPLDARNGPQIFVDGPQVTLLEVPQPWPRHDLQQVSVKG